MTDQTFGSRLKQLREAAGLTQEELAERAGMNRFGVSKLERDGYVPSWAIVRSLTKALGVSCSVFEDTIEPPTANEKPSRPLGRPKKAPPEPPAEQPKKRRKKE